MSVSSSRPCACYQITYKDQAWLPFLSVSPKPAFLSEANPALDGYPKRIYENNWSYFFFISLLSNWQLQNTNRKWMNWCQLRDMTTWPPNVFIHQPISKVKIELWLHEKHTMLVRMRRSSNLTTFELFRRFRTRQTFSLTCGRIWTSRLKDQQMFTNYNRKQDCLHC